ncbi:CDGSH iron-sulfur domain-containing protein [Paenibacillus andongensis]|uniref:CDGSH iron-sulfur domain-containing protein n=1 Tax=Paenibacillus andongensis TaxID=2975482 RepID=UPI0021BB5B7B|nr:CDGSH iron-sulfur domain-containing protein [Paenibacillus andongensis]
MSKVKITKYDDGPFVIQGNFELVDGSGNAFQTSDTIAVCRCGNTKTQPFCDGTHKACEFKETSSAR